MAQNIGIWLDFEKADIFVIENASVKKMEIVSEIETFHPSGGYGASIPYGTQNAMSESKFLERRKHQSKKYFHKIISKIQSGRAIMLFGPGAAKQELAKEIQKTAHLKDKLYSIITSDKMTINQKAAIVKRYYDSNLDN